MGKNVWLAQLVYIDDLHPEALTIGDNCSVGMRTSIFTHFYAGTRRPQSNGKVVIEANVFIGPHCVILPNVRIGQGSIISAGTVVCHDVPPGTLWGHPPAQALAEVAVPLRAPGAEMSDLQG